jgi:hypothetical protein
MLFCYTTGNEITNMRRSSMPVRLMTMVARGPDKVSHENEDESHAACTVLPLARPLRDPPVMVEVLK